MLRFLRQCATIQITVTNENGVMVFDQSAGMTETYQALERA